MANKISNLASIAAEIKKAAELAKKNNASKPVSGTTRATTNTRGANNLNYSANRQTSSPDFEGIRAAAQTARGANNPNYNANRTTTQTSQNTMPSFTQSERDQRRIANKQEEYAKKVARQENYMISAPTYNAGSVPSSVVQLQKDRFYRNKTDWTGDDEIRILELKKLLETVGVGYNITKGNEAEYKSKVAALRDEYDNLLEIKKRVVGGTDGSFLPDNPYRTELQGIGDNIEAAIVGGFKGLKNLAVGTAAAGARMVDKKYGIDDHTAVNEWQKDNLVDNDAWNEKLATDNVDANSPLGVINAVAQGVGGMLPTIASNAVLPGSGIYVMMSSAAGNSMVEALQNGATEDEAYVYGLASGAVEGITEKITGGIPGLGAGGLDAVTDKVIGKLAKSVASRYLFKQAANMLGEGFEEWLSEAAGQYLIRIYDEEARNESISDTWVNRQADRLYSALLGSLTSLVMSAPTHSGAAVSEYNNELEYNKYRDEIINSFVKEGKTKKEAAEIADALLQNNVTAPNSPISATFNEATANSPMFNEVPQNGAQSGKTTAPAEQTSAERFVDELSRTISEAQGVKSEEGLSKLFNEDFYKQFEGEDKSEIKQTVSELEAIKASPEFEQMTFEEKYAVNQQLRALKAGFNNAYDYEVATAKNRATKDYQYETQSGNGGYYTDLIKKQNAQQVKTQQLEQDIAASTPHKNAQYNIIQASNPAFNDTAVWVRSPKDIQTFGEVVNDPESFTWGDFSREDAAAALKRGSVRVYSSYPIKNGTFVSTSYAQALDYAGGDPSKVHSRTVALDSVAWINGDEGQYAKVKENLSKFTKEGLTKELTEIYNNADKLIADQTARATQESSILNPITNNATLPQITSRDVFNATTGAYEPAYNANPSSVDVTYNEPNFEGIREAANEAKKNKPNLNAISEAVNTMQTASNTQTTPNLDDLYFTQDNLYDENEAPADISDLDSLKTYSSELEISSDYGRLKQGLNKLDSAKDYIEAQRNGNYLDRIAAEREAQATESAVATATPAQESVPTTPKLTEADIPQDAPEEVKTLFNDVISGEIGVIDTPVPVDVAQSLTDKGFSFLKDIWRNVEAITNGNGKALTWFKENILQPLENAKRTRVNNMYTILTAYKQAMNQYGIKKGSKESAATMWLGEGQKPNGEEYTIDNLKTDFPETWQNIVAFEKVNRAIYDSFVERENNALKQIYPDVEARAAADLNSLIANKESLRQQLITQREGISRGDTSYKPEGVNYTEQVIAALDVKIADLQAKIESGEYFRNKRMFPRKNYYRHFQEQLQGVEGLRNILSTSQEIDPDLVAISADTKPKSKWASYMQERKGGKYTADAVSAMLDYVPAAEYKINIDPITARIRGVVTSLAQATKQTVNANKAILFLTRYADSLAGKTNSMDRAVQEIVGRKAMASLGWVNSRVKSNVILGNVRSAFTQFANIPNISLYITNPASHIKGVLNSLSKGSTEQSAFLKERYESDLLDSFEPKWTPKQFALKMLSLGDKVGSTIAWNVAYEEAVRTGENDPVSYADNLTRKIVAGRGVGELPLTMQSKVANLLAPFQVEVANTFNAVQDATKSKNAAGKVAGWMASTFVFNTIAEALTGARPLPDMIDAIIDAIKGWDKDKDEYENITDIMARLSGEALSFVPFSSLITSLAVGDDAETLFGEADPTRYGTANIGTGAIADVWSDVKEGDFGSAALNSLDLLLPWGGTQLKRTIEGISTVAKGGEKNANDGLKYSVENEGLEGLGNYITGGLFGKWALDDAKDYIDRGFTALYGPGRTVAREQAIANGMSADAFDGYFDNLTGSTRYDALFALASSDLTDSEKETLWNATNSDWQQSYADFYEENKAILDSGLTAEALNEYKQSVKDLTTEEKREQILNDTSLSVGQKNALSSALTGGNVDYTNAETFTVSQLSDKQQYEWDIVKAQGLTLDQYTTALDSYYEGGTPSKDVGIQRLVKAGFTKEWANWFYTYVLNDKSGSASSETPEKREYFINLLTNAGYDESYYDKAYEAYNQYGSKDQRIERIVAEGFTREWAEWFYEQMQKKVKVDDNGNYYLY